uniref:Glycosyltransferase n=1 Tax=Acidobacterium capsulatum TaxID=33075 RepID=A0A7V4XUJ7_9BACT
MRRVLYLRAELLPPSETFVAAQAAALRRYRAGFAGLKRVPCSAELPGTVAVLDACGNWTGRAARLAHGWTGSAPAFEAKLAAWRPDLLHAHFATDACAFLPVARRLGLPLVVTLHGYDAGLSDAAHARTALGRIFLRRREELWAHAVAFVCVSEHLRRVAVARGFPEEKLWVHRTGVPVEDRLPASAGRRERGHVLFVGRLVEKKGCAKLLAAMERVEKRHAGARLTVMGDGPLRGALEAQARDRLRRCTFAGAEPHAVVRRVMETATVLAVPSVRAANGDCEGLPTVILEAMERGLPVVAFDGSGAEEAMEDGVNGWLAEAGDEEALAEALLRVLRDPARTRQMGEEARRHVERHLNLAVQTERLEAEYDARIQQGIPGRMERIDQQGSAVFGA